MSYTTDRYSIERLSGQSLAVVQCGIQICDPSHCSGMNIPSCYSISFVIEGKGVYYVEGKEYEVSAGQGFLIIPGLINKYTADEKEPWKYIFASFNGPDDDTLVHNAGLDETNVVFNFPFDDAMINDLYAMHKACKSYDALGYDVTGYFLLVMSRLIKQNTREKETHAYPEYYLKKAVLYMENNYNRDISVRDVANFVNIDRTYLFKIFKKYLNKSASAWLLDYRLKKSIEIMENKELSINEIADLTGFYDVSHFYKAFSEKYGVTPKKFRQQMYEKKSEDKEEK